MFPGEPIQIIPSDESKLGYIRLLDAVGIIDDKPDTLIEVADAGLLAATIITPFNQKLVRKRDDIIGFRSWGQAFWSGLATEIVRRQRARHTA